MGWFHIKYILNVFAAGKVGKWAEHLTSEQSAYIDKICQMYLTSAGIEPQFELGGKKDQKQAPKQEPQPVGQK